MATLTPYTPIPNGSEATPGLWDRRFDTLQANIQAVEDGAIDPSASVLSLAGRLYVAGRIHGASNVSAQGKFSTDSIIEFTRAGGLVSNLSAAGTLRVQANGGQLRLDSNTLVAFYYGGVQKASAGDYGFLVNSGVTFQPYGPVLLTGMTSASTPTSGTAAGSAGEIRSDTSALYVCVSDNSWKYGRLTGF